MSTELRDKLQSTLGDAYRLDRELKGGGMASVFLAEEIAIRRKEGVKAYHQDLVESISADRFKREMKFAAKLQHPHIVPLLSAGDMQGVLFYTMPFIEGESLRDRMTREPEMAFRAVVAILRDILGALSYAHKLGVVHRDIKPENVLFSHDQPLVLDFGIAK